MKNICTICGKEFDAIKSTKKYCSTECANLARRIRYAEQKKQPKPLNQRSNNCPERACLICEKIFKPKTAAANQRQCCYDCMPDGTQLTRGDFLAKIKISRGGACEKCGYHNCLKALEFHHLDPTKKDFTISNEYFKLKDAVEESKKCILLCSNCHRELHDNLWNISDINIQEKEEVKPNAANNEAK